MLGKTQRSHNSTFKPRTTRLRPGSAKRSGEARQQAAVYWAQEAVEWCAACGRPGPLDHSHILTQKQHPKHRNNPLNWLMLCRQCHATWEDNKARLQLLYPDAFAEKMHRMRLLDAQAYAVFRMKWVGLFPGG